MIGGLNTKFVIFIFDTLIESPIIVLDNSVIFSVTFVSSDIWLTKFWSLLKELSKISSGGLYNQSATVNCRQAAFPLLSVAINT